MKYVEGERVENFWRFALQRPTADQRRLASWLDDLVVAETIKAYAAWKVVRNNKAGVRWSVLGIDGKRRDFDTTSGFETWLDGLRYGLVDVVRDALRDPS